MYVKHANVTPIVSFQCYFLFAHWDNYELFICLGKSAMWL